LTWSIVCVAPVARSSGGRSAVRTTIGVRAWSASTTAGSRFAAAVPDVVTTTAGTPSALAMPTAMNEHERSSRTM
jgi:hypothetical protein